MVDVNKTKQVKTGTAVEADLGKVDFGASTAKAAFAEVKQAAGQIQEVKQSKQKTEKNAKPAKSHEKSLVEQREEQTRKEILAHGGKASGAVLNNRQLTKGGKPQNQVTEVEDAWEDANEVNARDDLQTALEKRAAAAEQIESQIESPLGTEDIIVDLSEADGLNSASQPIRDFGNYGSLDSPELLILMNGISESFDALLQRNGVELPDASQLTSAQLQEVFDLLNIKKKKNLSTEEEEEAELILGGAVAILAIPQIKEKLESMGLQPEEAKSFEGILKQLVENVSQDDHPLNSLYQLIKEETEYSIVPEDGESSVN